MSLTKRVLRKLQRSVPGTRLCKSMLVIAPTEHILRGFMFSYGIPIKGRCFFEKVITPLYIPENPIFLSYSDRIPNDEVFNVSTDNIDEVSDRLLKLVTGEGHLDYLRNLYQPQDFLVHIEKHPWYGRAFAIDLALTHYVSGNVSECMEILEKEFATDDGFRPTPKSKGAMALFEELKTNPENAARRIESWERENIERLGLAEVMVGAR